MPYSSTDSENGEMRYFFICAALKLPCFKIQSPGANLNGIIANLFWGMRWRSVSRHCAASRKIAGSNSVGVTKIFQLINSSGRTVKLRLTYLLERNVYHGYLLGRKGGRGVRMTTF